MKKILVLSLIVIMLTPAFPQDLKEMHLVGKAKKLNDGEMVARRDQNGNYCAAIQVISDMDGFSYNSWDGIVGDVDSNPGKDVVFLTATERVLEIFKSGYQPLKVILSDFDINLKSREMWEIKIAGEAAVEELPVVIRYTPDDAQLYVDGTELQKAATYALAIGKHEVKLVKEGYQDLFEQITVSKDKVLFEWQLEKIKDVALQISSEPEGATVFIDRIKMGETPLAAFYPPGTYPIKIVKDGYMTVENEYIEIIAPQTRKNYQLKENAGYLTINTHANATVFFNDKIIEKPERVKLSPQLVKVKVTMPKADDLEQQVLLKKDDDIVLNMYPEVKTGTIQVAVTPFDAKVELFRNSINVASGNGATVFENIEIGEYKVAVKRNGYFTQSEYVSIKQDEKTTLSIKLLEHKSVVIKTKPSGAAVSLNGYSVGKTPVNVEVKKISNTIKVTKEGYEDWDIKMDAESKQKEFSKNLIPDNQVYKTSRRKRNIDWLSYCENYSGLTTGYYTNFNAFFIDGYIMDYFTASFYFGDQLLGMDWLLTYKFCFANSFFGVKPLIGYSIIGIDTPQEFLKYSSLVYGFELLLLPEATFNGVFGLKKYETGKKEFPSFIDNTILYFGIRLNIDNFFEI